MKRLNLVITLVSWFACALSITLAHATGAEQVPEHCARRGTEWWGWGGRQAALDEGLDAIKVTNWKLAIEKLSWLVDQAHLQVYYSGVDCRDSNAVRYERFAAAVPVHVFANLALASDRAGGAPLRTAVFYRAYLAYDPQTPNRTQIESRIGELEREHQSYIAPLCKVVEAFFTNVNVQPGTMESTLLPNYQHAPADCVRALVLIDDTESAERLEKRLRATFFAANAPFTDPSVLHLAYARAYKELGNERELAVHVAQLSARFRDWGKSLMDRKRNREQPVFPGVDEWWLGGRAGSALYWKDQWKPAGDGMLYGDQDCDQLSLEDIGAFMAANNQRHTGSDFVSLMRRAGAHACAAITFARSWLFHQRKIERWSGARAR